MARHVTHYRSGRNFVVCGADKPRRNWGVVRDVSAVIRMADWDATPEASRCTRCSAKVAKMKAVKAKQEARESTPASKSLPTPLQRLRDRHEMLHANDGASMGLLF